MSDEKRAWLKEQGQANSAERAAAKKLLLGNQPTDTGVATPDGVAAGVTTKDEE